ncbi:MAG: hypothetical protein U1E15_08380 [Hyphomicrobiales bacterium]
MFVRSLMTAALGFAILIPASGEASAGFWHRHRVRLPHVYLPTITGNLFDDAGSDTYDNGDGYAPSRRAYIDDPGADSLDPVYQPPVKKKVTPKSAKKVATVKPVSKPKSVAAVPAKPAPSIAKTDTQVASIAPVTVKAPIVAKPAKAAPLSLAAVDDEKSDLPTASTSAQAAVPAKKPLPSVPATTVKDSKVASLQSAGGSSIACSKGAEIVSGYGFTSVKPKTCTGTTFSFDAARGANAYVIKLAAATQAKSPT